MDVNTTSLSKLEKQLVKETDPNEISNIVNIFNSHLQKKTLIRSMKLSEVQDCVVNQMSDRLKHRADEISNDDLIKYHKVIQDTLDKSSTSVESVTTPNIMINQQVNVESITLDVESRKRILDAVNNIIKAKAMEETIIESK